MISGENRSWILVAGYRMIKEFFSSIKDPVSGTAPHRAIRYGYHEHVGIDQR